MKKKIEKEVFKLKRLVLFFAAVIIGCSLGHQINGGYRDPRKSRIKYIRMK